MDFYDLQKKIEDYIKQGFNAYLGEDIKKPSYVSDNIDLDKYKGDFSVFFDFSSFDFEDLSNESMKASLTMDLYFVRRNGTSETLKKDLLSYVSKFYAFFYTDRSFGNLIDWGTITELNNYDAVSGDKNIKITQLTLRLELEDD